MEYLIKTVIKKLNGGKFLNVIKKKSVAHYWINGDTACHMYSTGGLKKSTYKLFDSPKNKKICHMCKNNLQWQNVK